MRERLAGWLYGEPVVGVSQLGACEELIQQLEDSLREAQRERDDARRTLRSKEEEIERLTLMYDDPPADGPRGLAVALNVALLVVATAAGALLLWQLPVWAP